MGNLQDVINRLSSMDMDSLESLENAEVMENYLRSIPVAQLPAGIRGALTNVNIPRPMASAAPLATPVNSFRTPISAATFDILINRETSNINGALPVVLFGSLDRESSYVEVVTPELPSGVTYTISTTTDKKGLKFTFTDGVVTDIVTINCNETPYLNLLRASQGAMFKMQQNKMLISDVAIQSQFSQKVQVVKRSMFGSNSYDTFTPNQYKTDLQNQNDIRTIDAIIDIDLERSLLVNVAKNTVDKDLPFLVTLTSFIQKFEKPAVTGRF